MRLVFTKKNHKTDYFECNSGVTIDIDNICFFCDEDIEAKDKDMVWQIEPYVHFPCFESCKVGMRLKELEMNKETKEYDIKVYKKDKKSQFRLSTKVLKMIVNLEACIIDEIEKKGIDGLYEETFIVNYDTQTEYIRLSDINDRLLKYLRKFSELEPKINLDTVKLAEYLFRKNHLEKFKTELSYLLLEDEHKLEDCLKKYKELLPLVIPNLDATIDFQFRILPNDNLTLNIADAISNQNGENENIIELKRADQELFVKDKKYRNNTYSLSKEFSSAIQQVNVQRSRHANVSNNKYSTLSKSTLIIGNKAREFDEHLDKEDLYYNLNIVRYNNKDCQIITYDEILNNIDKLLGLMKSPDEL